MSSPRRNGNDSAKLADLQSSHGIRRERKVAVALQSSHQALRKRQKSALYVSLAWLLSCGLLLAPVAGRALREHTPWAMTLLAIFLVIHLAWTIQILKLASAWLRYQKLKELQ